MLEGGSSAGTEGAVLPPSGPSGALRLMRP